MNRRRLFPRAAIALAVGVLPMLAPSPASADSRIFRNDPAHYLISDCEGDVWINTYWTDRSDVYSATYYDEYGSNWTRGTRSHYLHDSWTVDKLMLSGVRYGTFVRIRAEHYVTAYQGPNC